jgi:hypothetical protein
MFLKFKTCSFLQEIEAQMDTRKARITYLGFEYGRMKNYGTIRSKHGWGTKKTYSLYIKWTPSLEHVISKLNGTFILKVHFSSYIHTLTHPQVP